MLGAEEVLNSNPPGAFRISVTPVPAEKSVFFPSAIVIAPSVVQEPEPPMPAVSAEIAEPPDAAVNITDAHAVCMAPGRQAIPNSRNQFLHQSTL
jgi:hypothetical protein